MVKPTYIPSAIRCVKHSMSKFFTGKVYRNITKVKFTPEQAPKATNRYSANLSLTSTLGGQRHVPAALFL